MPTQILEIGEPFLGLKVITDEPAVSVTDKAIVLNLAQSPITIREQHLGALQSVILRDVDMQNVAHAVVIDRFDQHEDEADLLERIRDRWPTAFDVRGEDRLRGIQHYMSPKVWLGQFGFTLYHSAGIPLNVGLHREHEFCPVPGFREVHTQIVGFGKMQQCRERDTGTLYLEESMAPGTTHRPMYDELGNYPWHQFETTTPSVILAVEMLPDGVEPLA